MTNLTEDLQLQYILSAIVGVDKALYTVRNFGKICLYILICLTIYGHLQ